MTARQSTEHVLIVGASSGIAQALSAVLARRDCTLVLAGRNRDELERSAADLRVRYRASVFVESFDATDFSCFGTLFRNSLEHLGGVLDGVVVCHGYLPDQQRAENDPADVRRTVDINFTSVVVLLNIAADYLRGKRRGGYLAAISSVAGERGRQSNFIYGAAKAGLSAYLDGLRNRLHSDGIHVLSIKPGFVATAMTQGLVREDSPLVAKPERVARDIDRAIRRRQNTLYTPWFWRPIMAVIRAVPEPLFKRLKL
jgi:decaprenylphospho-beta-D-erythro-pentofuranosid-2-ulose 2-reductase